MKIALISPHFPPHRCGVGDYTFLLANEIAAQNHQVKVFSSQASPIEHLGIDHQTIPEPWNWKALNSIQEHLADWKPTVVILEYTPYLFAPQHRGVHPSLAFWVRKARRALNCAFILTAHELNYPVEFSLKGILLGIPQFLQFLGIASAVDRVFYTSDLGLAQAARYLPWRKKYFTSLPVGSNIQILKNNGMHLQKEALLKSASLNSNQKILLHFGGLHPTHLFRFQLLALDRASQEFGIDKVALVCAGLDHNLIVKKTKEEGFEHLIPAVRGLGYLSSEQVSLWFQMTHVVLAPFMDGISTRRGSFMAALAHRVPVVTTRGWSTSSRIEWEQFCRITPANDADAFANTVTELLKNETAAKQLSKTGFDYYEKHFSWKAIANSISEVTSGMTTA